MVEDQRPLDLGSRTLAKLEAPKIQRAQIDDVTSDATREPGLVSPVTPAPLLFSDMAASLKKSYGKYMGEAGGI